MEVIMRDWLDVRLGLSTEEAIGIASVLVTILLALTRPIRRGVRTLGRTAQLVFGVPTRRYCHWFSETYGKYDNPYLADTEDLDLRTTYVSLFFRNPSGEAETRITAIQAVADEAGLEGDRAAGRIMIEGDPGSGKSTLLKAYGVALSRDGSGFGLAGSVREIPFLVPMRKLAAELPNVGGLAEYIVREILMRDVGMTRYWADAFFRRALEKRRCLVLLDGLDAIPLT
jgi:hypothetical protein